MQLPLALPVSATLFCACHCSKQSDHVRRNLRNSTQSNFKTGMKKHLLLILGFVIGVARGASGDSWWPQFRGPNSCGVSESATPPVKFGPGTNQLWKISPPPGASSPCIWRDHIFLTAFDAGKLMTLCYQRRMAHCFGKARQALTNWRNFTRGRQPRRLHARDGRQTCRQLLRIVRAGLLRRERQGTLATPASRRANGRRIWQRRFADHRRWPRHCEPRSAKGLLVARGGF